MSLSSIHSSRFTDFSVLLISFLVFSLMTGFNNIELLAIECILYVSIIFVSLRVAKRLTFQYFHHSTRVTSVLVGNSAGLIVGSFVVAIVFQLLFSSSQGFVAILFPSILAFFVLGTLSPMVKSSQRDIIHH